MNDPRTNTTAIVATIAPLLYTFDCRAWTPLPFLFSYRYPTPFLSLSLVPAPGATSPSMRDAGGGCGGGMEVPRLPRLPHQANGPQHQVHLIETRGIRKPLLAVKSGSRLCLFA